jgi:hypothetical protein
MNGDALSSIYAQILTEILAANLAGKIYPALRVINNALPVA